MAGSISVSELRWRRRLRPDSRTAPGAAGGSGRLTRGISVTSTATARGTPGQSTGGATARPPAVRDRGRNRGSTSGRSPAELGEQLVEGRALIELGENLIERR